MEKILFIKTMKMFFILLVLLSSTVSNVYGAAAFGPDPVTDAEVLACSCVLMGNYEGYPPGFQRYLTPKYLRAPKSEEECPAIHAAQIRFLERLGVEIPAELREVSSFENIKELYIPILKALAERDPDLERYIRLYAGTRLPGSVSPAAICERSKRRRRASNASSGTSSSSATGATAAIDLEESPPTSKRPPLPPTIEAAAGTGGAAPSALAREASLESLASVDSIAVRKALLRHMCLSPSPPPTAFDIL